MTLPTVEGMIKFESIYFSIENNRIHWSIEILFLLEGKGRENNIVKECSFYSSLSGTYSPFCVVFFFSIVRVKDTFSPRLKGGSYEKNYSKTSRCGHLPMWTPL